MSSYTKVHDYEINIFFKPARLIIAGFSGAGKSYLTSLIIAKYRHKFHSIIGYGTPLENGKEMGIIQDDEYNPFDEPDSSKSKLLIFDDIIMNRNIMNLASEVYIRGRHLNISCIFLSQNIFLQDKSYRIIALNCTHVVLLRQRDLRQIVCFARTFLPSEKIDKFISLYKKEVLKKRHQYILIDFTSDFDGPLAIRSSIVNEDSYERAFLI